MCLEVRRRVRELALDLGLNGGFRVSGALLGFLRVASRALQLY